MRPKVPKRLPSVLELGQTPEKGKFNWQKWNWSTGNQVKNTHAKVKKSPVTSHGAGAVPQVERGRVKPDHWQLEPPLNYFIFGSQFRDMFTERFELNFFKRKWQPSRRSWLAVKPGHLHNYWSLKFLEFEFLESKNWLQFKFQVFVLKKEEKKKGRKCDVTGWGGVRCWNGDKWKLDNISVKRRGQWLTMESCESALLLALALWAISPSSSSSLPSLLASSVVAEEEDECKCSCWMKAGLSTPPSAVAALSGAPWAFPSEMVCTSGATPLPASRWLGGIRSFMQSFKNTSSRLDNPCSDSNVCGHSSASKIPERIRPIWKLNF